MISKINRLDKKAFDFIMKSGRPVHSPLFTLRFIKNSEISGKFAFVVPKSVEKLATKRNYLRRKGYNALRPLLKDLKNNKSFSGIFFIKKEAKSTPFLTWSEEIKKLIIKIS